MLKKKSEHEISLEKYNRVPKPTSLRGWRKFLRNKTRLYYNALVRSVKREKIMIQALSLYQDRRVLVEKRGKTFWVVVMDLSGRRVVDDGYKTLESAHRAWEKEMKCGLSI